MKRLAALFSILFCAVAGYAKHPIVFLHGWHSESGIWSSMRKLLSENDGYDSSQFCAPTYKNFGYNKNTPIEDVAEGMAREVAEMYYECGNEPVDLIGHSMGGLVVRAMVANGDIERKWIGRFVSLATPNYGQNIDLDIGGYQSRQMKYGSKFLWNLAVAWQYDGAAIPDSLCIAGIARTHNGKYRTGYSDVLVYTWAASLPSVPIRYVSKAHSDTLIFKLLYGSPIYACSDKTSDDVYKLVRTFLRDGSVLEQNSLSLKESAQSVQRSMNRGGLFFQVVEPNGKPVAYSSSVSCIAPVYWHQELDEQIRADYLEHGYKDAETQKYSIELVYGTMPAGNYRVEVKGSATSDAFVVHDVPIRGGEVNTVWLQTDGTLYASKSPELVSEVKDDVFVFNEAGEWNGLLKDGENVAGTISVKVSNLQFTTARATVKISIPGRKTKQLKGWINLFTGKLQIDSLALSFNSNAMHGTFGSFAIESVCNPFNTKNKKELAEANEILARWKGPVNVAWADGNLSVKIASKGRVNIAGNLHDGTKVSATSRLLVGEEWLCVPIVWAKKNSRLAFNLWLAKDGTDAIVEGLADAEAGRPGALSKSILFTLKTDALPDYIRTELLPWEVPVSVNKSKLAVPQGLASSLKLKYNAKTGAFKGGFVLFANTGGKTRKLKANINGILIGGEGRGMAVIKGLDSLQITLECF